MRLSLKKLIDLPVETEIGESLGKVIDLNLDINNHTVIDYVIQFGLVKRQKLLVKPVQVIKITNEKMVVDDAILKNKTSMSLRSTLSAGASMLANVSQTIK